MQFNCWDLGDFLVWYTELWIGFVFNFDFRNGVSFFFPKFQLSCLYKETSLFKNLYLEQVLYLLILTANCYTYFLASHLKLGFSALETWNAPLVSSFSIWWNLLPYAQLDRFIPNRSAMDFDYAHYMLTEGRKGKENPASSSPSREAYRKRLAETFNMNRTRILAFKNKPPVPVESFPREFSSSLNHDKPTKSRRNIPQVGISF